MKFGCFGNRGVYAEVRERDLPEVQGHIDVLLHMKVM